MDNNVELGLGKSTDSPDHGISLLDIPEDRPQDDTSLAAHIANFPAREATQSVCRTWITGLAATRQLDDRVDQSVIYCLGRDLWAVQSAADAMVLLSDQEQLTEGMKLLLARDIEATATEARRKQSNLGQEKQEQDGDEDVYLLLLGLAAAFFFCILLPIYYAKKHPKIEDISIE